ncbi:MAG: hypothetical protein JOZ38_02370 [Candidatus Eremiobacteraeota bacterium]|nr:hypothetical protein [Candidatus Eremiobacteraeota bacterium]
MSSTKTFLWASFLAVATALPNAALAGGASSKFWGEAVHVSTTNIKVYNPKDKRALSFVLTPKFDQVFSADGKTTYQMKDVKTGQYVEVIYDQKALGMRHADKILIMKNDNEVKGTQ